MGGETKNICVNERKEEIDSQLAQLEYQCILLAHLHVPLRQLTCLTALSISQSLKIIRGDLPPNSREHFFRLLVAQLFTRQKETKKNVFVQVITVII
jgi:hypothetical protein